MTATAIPPDEIPPPLESCDGAAARAEDVGCTDDVADVRDDVALVADGGVAMEEDADELDDCFGGCTVDEESDSLVDDSSLSSSSSEEVELGDGGPTVAGGGSWIPLCVVFDGALDEDESMPKRLLSWSKKP